MLDERVVEGRNLIVGARRHDSVMVGRMEMEKNDKTNLRGPFYVYIFRTDVKPQYNFVDHPSEAVPCLPVAVQLN
jgi:hypothetical protein